MTVSTASNSFNLNLHLLSSTIYPKLDAITLIEELELLLHHLLNEGALIIKWGRKLKNKGNAIITV